MTMRVMTVEFVVQVPSTVGEADVSNAVNSALDEPPCNWGDWTVSLARIVSVQHLEEDESDALRCIPS